MLRFLNFFYFPFIGFLAFLQLAVGVGCIVAACVGGFETAAVVCLWILGIFFLILFGTFLTPMYYFFTWEAPPEWRLDMKVSREEAPVLYDLMDDVARRCDLPIADQIHLSPLTDAAVYQTKKGRQVLLIGALTVASFPPEVVAAIMAHELAHIEGGDTEALRNMMLTRRLMAITGAYYRINPQGFLHPFVWLVFLYQFVFDVVFARTSRRWEYAADQAGRRQAGESDTAVGLFYVHVTPLIEGCSLNDLLKSLARTQSFHVKAFTEQVSNVRAASKKDWKRAMRSCLFHGTRLFDDHPCLKSRLRALDVDPEDALDWALNMNGDPLSYQIRGWQELEKKLTIRVLAPYIDAIEVKKDIAAIFKAS
jgi:Zn-dependent protease with chaperone function